MSKLLSIVSFLAVEALVVIGFNLLLSDLPSNVFYLDLIVAVFVVALLFIDVIFNVISVAPGAKRWVGNVGVRWFATSIYAVVAIGIMVYGRLAEDQISFEVQALAQGVAFVFLLLGVTMSAHSGDKVAQVEAAQSANRLGLDSVRSAMILLSDKVAEESIGGEIKSKIDALADNLRFVSPCNTPEARLAEEELVDQINAVTPMLANLQLNSESVLKCISRIERLVARRKAMMSR